jgi:predicted exporter
VVLLYLLVVRSPRGLLLSFVPPLAGLVVATAGALVVAGRLHALTVAFGATLIGVAIDSPTHLVVHHALSPDPEGPEGTARALWPALVLCALTTVVGLAGLAWTSMPGLREVALFTSVGIVTALLTTRFVVAPLLGSGPPPPALARAAAWSTRLLERARARRGLLAAPALAALVVCAVGLPRARWTDDPAALQRPPGDLLEEDARVRARVARVDGGRLVVARGADVEAALQAGERAVARLEPLVARGALEGLRSVRSLLPSRALQARNLAELRRAPDLAARLDRAFAAEGFRRGAFAPFAEALEGLRAPGRGPAVTPMAEGSWSHGRPRRRDGGPERSRARPRDARGLAARRPGLGRESRARAPSPSCSSSCAA